MKNGASISVAGKRGRRSVRVTIAASDGPKGASGFGDVLLTVGSSSAVVRGADLIDAMRAVVISRHGSDPVRPKRVWREPTHSCGGGLIC